MKPKKDFVLLWFCFLFFFLFFQSDFGSVKWVSFADSENFFLERNYGRIRLVKKAKKKKREKVFGANDWLFLCFWANFLSLFFLVFFV